MKKILTLLLVLALSLTVLVGCDVINGILGGEQPPVETPDNGNENETPDTPEVDADLQAAYDYIHQNAKAIAEVTGANYDLIGTVEIGSKNYKITWTVSDERVTVTENDNGMVTIVIPKSDADFNYTLKFSVTNEKGETLSREYKHIVPEFKVASFEEYMQAAEGANVTVKGIVVAINAKSAGNTRNHLFLIDEDVVGGYYSYQMDQDPLEMGIEVGMTVVVNGPVAPYYGMQEIKGGVAEVLSTEIKSFDYVDVTEDFANGDNLAKYTAMPVVIKGVTLGTQELGGSSDYLRFSLNGKESYIRTYKTDFPTTLPVEAKETIEAAHAAHFGWTADVYGLVVLYSNSPYLIPLSADCFTNYVEVERTDAEKVDTELSLLTVSGKYTADAVVELLAAGNNYSDVTFAWTVEGTGAALEGNTLTLTVGDEKSTVTLKVVATCGEASAEKTFTIELSKEVTPLADVIALGSSMEHNTYTTGKYLIAGVITEVYNEQYGNMRITDVYGNILTVYGTYSADGTTRYDAMETKPVVGDYVVVLGVVGQYNGTAQTKNAWIQSWTSTTSVKDAIDLGAAKDHNDFTGDKILVTGTITEVYNATYGNMYITDAEGNVLTIYGSYDSTGANRYDKMSYQPVAGDVVTVLGVVGRYNETKQIKNGWIVAVTKGNTTPENPDPETPVDPNPETPVDPNPETPTEGNVLTSDKVYVSVPVESSGTYPSYGNYNGTYTINGMTITTADVLRNALGVPYVFQFKKQTGTLTVSNVTANSVTIVLVTTYDSFSTPVVTIGDVELTVDTAAMLATKEATGTQNDKGYDVYRYTITITLATAATGDLVVKNTSTYAMYLESIAFNGSTSAPVEPETPVDPEPETPETPDEPTTGATYVQVTNAADFTSGTYVIALSSGIAISHVDGTWVKAANVTAENGVVTNANGAVLTITVNNGKATIQDKNGTYIGAKGGNSNGISTTAYEWNVVFNADGTITFAGTGSDTVYFAYNSDAQYAAFRGYKTSTCNGDSAKYPFSFVAYKLA